MLKTRSKIDYILKLIKIKEQAQSCINISSTMQQNL